MQICKHDPFRMHTWYEIASAGTEEIYIDTDDRVYLFYAGPNNDK